MSNLSTIIVAIILLAIVALIIRSLVMGKKKGKCGGGCCDCGSSSVCHSHAKTSLEEAYREDHATH